MTTPIIDTTTAHLTPNSVNCGGATLDPGSVSGAWLTSPSELQEPDGGASQAPEDEASGTKWWWPQPTIVLKCHGCLKGHLATYGTYHL